MTKATPKAHDMHSAATVLCRPWLHGTKLPRRITAKRTIPLHRAIRQPYRFRVCNMNTSRRYHAYAGLDAEKQEIRLVELQPRDPEKDSTVRATLLNRQLSQQPEYEALSYVWGEATQTVPIQLDSQEFMVTKNLESALQHLTLTGQSRKLWVDAISINQRDLVERASQVQQMWKIYGNARAVRVWLDIEVPEDIVAKLAIVRVLDDLADDPEEWEPLHPLFDHEYWKRVWTQQEFAYAQEVVFQCRHVAIPQADIARFLKLASEFYQFRADRLDEITRNRWLAFNLSRGGGFWRPKQRYDLADTDQVRIHENLYEAFARTNHLLCSEPRDRIYGILSLLKHDSKDVIIDYYCTVDKLYYDIVKLLLRKYQSLAFLNIVGLGMKEKHEDNRPSWLPGPDSQEKSSNPTGKYGWNELLAFSPMTELPKEVYPFISTDQRTLHVHGFHIGTVGEMTESMSWQVMPEHRGPFLMDWFLTLFKASVLRDDDLPRTIWAFARTMSQRTLPASLKDKEQLVWKEAERVIMTTAQQALGMPNALEKSDAYIDEGIWPNMVRRWNLNTEGHWLVVLEHGGLVLARHGTRVGDQLWMVFGNAFPIILRPNGDQFEVIGSAEPDYVELGDIHKDMKTYNAGDKLCGPREICRLELV